mmetsp:Transcript_10261/g.30475  ORF Transcript_10261/g.30475 Transcript_10261/m.30475 type:complete len:209 (-) Transcript_10261:566-1192(-)
MSILGIPRPKAAGGLPCTWLQAVGANEVGAGKDDHPSRRVRIIGRHHHTLRIGRDFRFGMAKNTDQGQNFKQFAHSEALYNVLAVLTAHQLRPRRARGRIERHAPFGQGAADVVVAFSAFLKGHPGSQTLAHVGFVRLAQKQLKGTHVCIPVSEQCAAKRVAQHDFARGRVDARGIGAPALLSNSFAQGPLLFDELVNDFDDLREGIQ